MLQDFSTQETSPINVQELLERCMGNFDLAERVLEKLQSRFSEDMAELEGALAAKDAILIAGIAHRLKGAASNVAAHDLQKSAATIEDLARNGLVDNLPMQLEILRKQWSRINKSQLPCAT